MVTPSSYTVSQPVGSEPVGTPGRPLELLDELLEEELLELLEDEDAAWSAMLFQLVALLVTVVPWTAVVYPDAEAVTSVHPDGTPEKL